MARPNLSDPEAPGDEPNEWTPSTIIKTMFRYCFCLDTQPHQSLPDRPDNTESLVAFEKLKVLTHGIIQQTPSDTGDTSPVVILRPYWVDGSSNPTLAILCSSESYATQLQRAILQSKVLDMTTVRCNNNRTIKYKVRTWDELQNTGAQIRPIQQESRKDSQQEGRHVVKEFFPDLKYDPFQRITTSKDKKMSQVPEERPRYFTSFLGWWRELLYRMSVWG